MSKKIPFIFQPYNMTDDIIMNRAKEFFHNIRHHAESDDYDEDEFLIQHPCHKRFRLTQYCATLSQNKHEIMVVIAQNKLYVCVLA